MNNGCHIGEEWIAHTETFRNNRKWHSEVQEMELMAFKS
jgi:hypothetical protein